MNIPSMKYRNLGRTALKVSILSLGTGGPNRLGQRSGLLEPHISRLIRRALELGVNFIDTAPSYGQSESILGRVLREVRRDSYILATKFSPVLNREICSPEQFSISVERSLKRLRVEYIDILQFHRVLPDFYHHVVERLAPIALQLQEQGKLRFLGITESTLKDYNHKTLKMALDNCLFDTIMVGYNFMNPYAEEHILPTAQKKNIGVICMVALRQLIRCQKHLKTNIVYTKERGIIANHDPIEVDPLQSIIGKRVLPLPTLGYKYVAAHPAVATVLTGTADTKHLEDNARSILGPPLAERDVEILRGIFSRVENACTMIG